MSLQYFTNQGEKLVAAVKAAGPIPGAIGFTLNNIRDLDSKLTTTTKKPNTKFWNPYAVQSVGQSVVIPPDNTLLPARDFGTVSRVLDDPGIITAQVRKLKPLVSVVGAGADAVADPFRGVGEQPTWQGLTRMATGFAVHARKIRSRRDL